MFDDLSFFNLIKLFFYGTNLTKLLSSILSLFIQCEFVIRLNLTSIEKLVFAAYMKIPSLPQKISIKKGFFC
jgi:hypothetical protein